MLVFKCVCVSRYYYWLGIIAPTDIGMLLYHMIYIFFYLIPLEIIYWAAVGLYNKCKGATRFH